MSSLSTIPESTVSAKRPLEQPAFDGLLSITGPYGKSVLQLELSEGTNSVHIETKIGQRRYTIDIKPTRGPVMSASVAGENKYGMTWAEGDTPDGTKL